MISYEDFSAVFHTVMAHNGQGRYNTDYHSRKFYILTEHLLKVSEVMNLTAIKEERAIILKHYVDSLSVAEFLPENAKIIDIGCGAGFPCLPLAVCRPDLTITALDSTEKRMKYVLETAQLLGLQNLTGIAARAEDAGKSALRESFDVCVARAVAELPVLAELCLPFVQVGGKFLAMKAARAQEELEKARRAIARLGSKVAAVHKIALQDNGEQDARVIIEIEKVSPTPKDLPRPYAKIVKKPL